MSRGIYIISYISLVLKVQIIQGREWRRIRRRRRCEKISKTTGIVSTSTYLVLYSQWGGNCIEVPQLCTCEIIKSFVPRHNFEFVKRSLENVVAAVLSLLSRKGWVESIEKYVALLTLSVEISIWLLKCGSWQKDLESYSHLSYSHQTLISGDLHYLPFSGDSKVSHWQPSCVSM